MDTYNIIKQAILDKVSLSGTYGGHPRHFSPHSIGKDHQGVGKVLTFQYGGGGSSGMPVGGEWRCFEINKLRNVVTNDSTWHTSNDHSKRNTCVTRVDVEAR